MVTTHLEHLLVLRSQHCSSIEQILLLSQALLPVLVGVGQLLQGAKHGFKARLGDLQEDHRAPGLDVGLHGMAER